MRRHRRSEKYIGLCILYGQHNIFLAFKETTDRDASTCEAEYVAASWCVCHAVWLRDLLRKMELKQLGATVIQIDNKSVIELANNPVNQHIVVRFHFIRDHEGRKCGITACGKSGSSCGYFYQIATESIF